jgi:hypothetical protein
MHELEVSCVKRNAVDSPLRRFLGVVFSVTDDWMTNRGKLHSNLILQSCHQCDSDERSGAETTFDAISKFSPGCVERAL